MAILGKHGGLISFACKDLINELKMDIAECGKDEIFAVWVRKYPEHGVELVVNYDFITDEQPIDKNREVARNERLVLMQANVLLNRLIKQNDPFEAYILDEI